MCSFEDGFAKVAASGQLYCNMTYDSVLCWPTTLAGKTAEMACPANIDGIDHDTTKNASKFCFLNGTWASRADYSACVPLLRTISEDELETLVTHNLAERIIYFIGYGTSSVALIIALGIFFYFKSLRCVRNTIHCHLMVTFLLRNIMFIIFVCVVGRLAHHPHNHFLDVFCKVLSAIFNYSIVTNFFWMLIEGLYLHVIIVWAYSADKIKQWVYIAIGWVIPVPISLTWIIVKSQLENDTCWLDHPESHYSYIIVAPILLVLAINVFFLVTIVWVLITKLRGSNSVETRQYRKAMKATLILFPLLGVIYVLFLIPPSDDPLTQRIFNYINALLQSTQGLAVAIFYCFMNSEVKTVISRKLNRWQDSRSISTRLTRASSMSARPSNGDLQTMAAKHGVRNSKELGLLLKKDSNDNERTGVKIADDLSTKMLQETHTV